MVLSRRMYGRGNKENMESKFKNVYFFNGTAYAGKSTMVKLLAEKYDGQMTAGQVGEQFEISLILKGKKTDINEVLGEA